MKFVNEEGIIDIGDSFLSPRIVIEIIESYFKIGIIDQGASYVNLRLIRLARLYGFPFIGPQASVEIWIDNKNGKLHYKFFWPEFYLIFIPFLMIPAVGQHIDNLIEICFVSLAFFLFVALFIFLDTRWASARFRKAFKFEIKP